MDSPEGPVLTGPEAVLAALDPEQREVALASRGRLRAGVGAAVVLSGAVALGASVLGLIAVVAFAFTQAVHSGYWLQRPILQPRLNPGGFQSQEVDAIGPPSVR